MAQTDYQTWKADLDSKVYENLNGSVTATNINQLLTDLGESVNWSISQRNNGVSIGTSPTVINFPIAMVDTDYSLMVRSYDASGEPVDYRVDNITAASFTVTGAVACTIDWQITK